MSQPALKSDLRHVSADSPIATSGSSRVRWIHSLVSRFEISEFAAAGSLVMMLAGLVLGGAVERPWQYFVLGGAFLSAWVATACGVWARRVAEAKGSAIGDLIGFVAIVLGQFAALCFFLNLASLILPNGVALILFWAWFGLIAIYAFASAVPAVRLFLVCCVFLGIPLSMLAVHLLHQRDEARQNRVEKNATELYRGFHELRDTHRK